MKKLVLLLMSILFVSCSQYNYHTTYQYRNMKQFNRKKHNSHSITHKRGDHHHPAVTKRTRKTLN
jgi:hypothetical protein